MKSRDFCYWLQGFFELADLNEEVPEKLTLTPQQVECIRRHLNMVFYHEIDPSMGDQAHQDALTTIHKDDDGEKPPQSYRPTHGGFRPGRGDIRLKC